MFVTHYLIKVNFLYSDFYVYTIKAYSYMIFVAWKDINVDYPQMEGGYPKTL